MCSTSKPGSIWRSALSTRESRRRGSRACCAHSNFNNGATGEVERYMPGFAESSSSRIVLKPEAVADFRSQLRGDETVITDLRRDMAGHPAFFVLRALPEGRIAYGVVATDYLVRLQQAIAFGARGHAVVLDKMGKVIGHPFHKWIDAEFDLSQIP